MSDGTRADVAPESIVFGTVKSPKLMLPTKAIA